jgi:hypothetical protein
MDLITIVVLAVAVVLIVVGGLWMYKHREILNKGLLATTVAVASFATVCGVEVGMNVLIVAICTSFGAFMAVPLAFAVLFVGYLLEVVLSCVFVAACYAACI